VADDPQDYHPPGFAPVLDDVVFQDQFADGRGFAWSWKPQVRKPPDTIKSILKDLVISVALLRAPRLARVPKDSLTITLGPWRNDKLNT
jgi:hypothetical protein